MPSPTNEPGTRRYSDMDPLEKALDAIRYAAAQDTQRGARQRARELYEAASLMERMAMEIGRLTCKHERVAADGNSARCMDCYKEV